MRNPNPWNIDFGDEQTLDLMEQEGYVFPHPLQSWVMPVLILEFEPDGRLCDAKAMGTCFSIAPCIVLTATHVLGEVSDVATMEARHVKVGVAFVNREDDGSVRQELLEVELVVVNPDHDVAILGLRPPQGGRRKIRYQSLPLSFEVPSIGTSVIALGYSESSSAIAAENTIDLRHRVRASRGRIEEIHVPRRDITLLNFPAVTGDYPSPGGMSGGPVITPDGAVAAIVCRAMDPGLDDNRWTSSAVLIQFLLAMRVEIETDGVVTSELIFELIERGAIASDGSHRSFEFVELPDGTVDYRWRHSES
jgi:hypothetical protein